VYPIFSRLVVIFAVAKASASSSFHRQSRNISGGSFETRKKFCSDIKQ
jgi:hypothetical protein